MFDPSILARLSCLLLKDRTQLALENIALRQQLAVYKRTVIQPRIEDRERISRWLGTHLSRATLLQWAMSSERQCSVGSITATRERLLDREA